MKMNTGELTELPHLDIAVLNGSKSDCLGSNPTLNSFVCSNENHVNSSKYLLCPQYSACGDTENFQISYIGQSKGIDTGYVSSTAF